LVPLKRLDAELTRQRQAAKLKAMNRSVAIASPKAQRKVLLRQIINTRLHAQNDVKVQKCLILARVGLDCDGHKQQIIIGGTSTTQEREDVVSRPPWSEITACPLGATFGVVLRPIPTARR